MHLSKRKLIHKILQRVDGLMNVTEAHFADKGNTANSSMMSNESIDQSAQTQQNLLQFFKFKQT